MLIRQLIEEMIGTYLDEDYEDLSESILDELSEETIEAIEEAILNELSPALLQRYIKKSKSSEKSAERDINKNQKLIDKAENDRVRAYHAKNKIATNDREDKKVGAEINRTAKSANNSQSNLKQAKNDLDTAYRKVDNRSDGIYKAQIRLDYKKLDADAFQKKYHMTKTAWERKNK